MRTILGEITAGQDLMLFKDFFSILPSSSHFVQLSGTCLSNLCVTIVILAKSSMEFKEILSIVLLLPPFCLAEQKSLDNFRPGMFV